MSSQHPDWPLDGHCPKTYVFVRSKYAHKTQNTHKKIFTSTNYSTDNHWPTKYGFKTHYWNVLQSLKYVRGIQPSIPITNVTHHLAWNASLNNQCSLLRLLRNQLRNDSFHLSNHHIATRNFHHPIDISSNLRHFLTNLFEDWGDDFSLLFLLSVLM